jgi:hypothetical protein
LIILVGNEKIGQEMMKVFFKLIMTMMFSLNSFAYQPTVESLFRNGSNADIGNNTVVANILIERMEEDQEAIATEESSNEEVPTLKLPKYNAFKLQIFNENEEKPKFIQLDYANETFIKNQIAKVHYKNYLNLQSLGFTEENVEGKIFYATLYSLLNNKGDMLLELLKSLGSEVKTNQELLNMDKITLLNQYKEYLKQKMEDEENEEIKNPLNVEDPEEREKIREILKQKFYLDSPYVQKIKERESFFWHVKEAVFEAKFTDSERHLLSLVINTPNGKVEFTFKDYILFNSTHEFPKEILFKNVLGKTFKITLKKLSIFADTTEKFNKRLNRYETSVKENNIQDALIKPTFML